MRFPLLISIVVLVFTSCKKEEPCSSKVSGLQQPVHTCLSPVMFDKGSEWVYQDTSSSAQENVSVSSWNGESSKDHKCGSYSAFLYIHYSSSKYGNYTEKYHKEDIFENDSGNLIYSCQGAEILDSLVVLGTTYYQVKKVTDISYSYTFPDKELYWADSIGIVRKVFYDEMGNTTTYDLQSYQVNMLSYPF